MNKIISALLLAAITTISLAGCHKAESPSEVSRDVAAAQNDAAQKVNDAREDAAKTVNEKGRELNNLTAKADYDVQVAKAEGAYKVEMQRCEALSGPAQTGCKNAAQAVLDASKANAEFKDGVLKVHLAKDEKAKPKAVEVKVA